jgi:prepilin-type processing-associated H-X9-DG protein
MENRQSSAVAIAACLAIVFGAGIWIIEPLLRSAKVTQQSATCEDNLRILSRAMLMYSQDYDETFPSPDAWADRIRSATPPDQLSPDDFHCPAASFPGGYAMNVDAPKADRPIDTVLLFDTDSRLPNAHGSRELLAHRRHNMLNCAFCDGHVHWVNPWVVNRWIWDPKSGKAM